MVSKEKVYWFDHKPTDDNDGYIYGLQYLFNDDVMYCQWYKTEEERDTNYELRDDIKSKILKEEISRYYPEYKQLLNK